MMASNQENLRLRLRRRGPGGKMATSLPQVITEEFLTCKICLDYFRQPKILNCLHTFCLGCLNDHSTKNEYLSEFPCPVCRQVTTITEGGIAALKDNFFVAGLQDVIKIEEKEAKEAVFKNCDSCKSRGDEKEARMRCLNCQEFLCPDCQEAHQRLNLTKNHITIAYDSDEEAKVHIETSETSVFCRFHTGEESKLYCEQCKVPICITCKLTNHESHKCCDVALAETQERNSLMQLCSNLNMKATQYERISKDWAAYEKELDQSERTTLKSVDERKNELIQLVEKWHNNNVEALTEAFKEERQLITDKMAAITEQTKMGESLSHDLEKIAAKMTPQQLFILADQLRTRGQSLEHESIIALALTVKLMPTCNFQNTINDSEVFGALEFNHEKVVPSAMILTQNLNLVRRFETRPTAAYRLRFDASSITVGRENGLIVTDRQLDSMSIYDMFGRNLLQINTSLMGKPISGIQLTNGDIVIVREKSSMCVFGPNGKDKRVIKENLCKPCCITIGKEGNLLVLDYELKTVFMFCGQTYNKITQICVQYKNSSKWDKLVVNSAGNLFICAHKENCIHEFSKVGLRLNTYGRGGNTGPGELYWPRGLTFDREGNLIVADSGNDCLQLMTPHGVWVNLQLPDECRLKCPTDVAMMEDGTIVVLESTGAVKLLHYTP